MLYNNIVILCTDVFCDHCLIDNWVREIRLSHIKFDICANKLEESNLRELYIHMRALMNN